jgi:hypothetical protein
MALAAATHNPTLAMAISHLQRALLTGVKQRRTARQEGREAMAISSF